MTSQIALHNSIGVAVASDTVVTHFSPAGEKTTQNAEKIFALNPPHKVVVLHSGSLHLNSTHIRVALTRWAESLPAALSSVQAYSESFVRFADNDTLVFPDESQVWLLDEVLNMHFRRIRDESFEIAARPDNTADLLSILRFRVKRNTEKLSNLEPFVGTSMSDEAKYLAAASDIDLQGKLEHYFSAIDGWNALTKEMIESAAMAMTRGGLGSSGVTLGFVGFGTDEVVARDVKMDVCGKYGGKLHYRARKPNGVSISDRSGSLHTFAQADAMWGFLRGIYPDVRREITDFLNAAFKHEAPDLDRDIRHRVVSALREHIDEYGSQWFTRPALQTMEGLSLTGLAQLAESLVGMQAARSASDNGPASVGGFIESLVIDRLDGIRWIHRLPR